MIIPILRKFFFLLTVLALATGCDKQHRKLDLTGIVAEVKMERFDRALFEMEADTINNAIGELYLRYGDFFDVFNVHVFRIGKECRVMV